ncbi:enoyl-CoA hydratase/isomerase family protein [Piscinibacter sakaiensis]|uniref:Enoyl-CoA hydratase n=1 Tax=Piscinibacter sakaiensis TaxID=1547922 RepID=A0A0K8NV86_PISS1|nr:enoyl-CoA hydratase/isomerase family protein [Piscinibacter sakaiensis]GAP34311.1 enoyl-CoA hydratase [Piscinibacter sakaiensis]
MNFTERFETLLVDGTERVLTVTLNRPEQLNAINARCRDELTSVFNRFRDDPDWRVLVITGAGRAFSAGADLKDGSVDEDVIDSVESRWLGDFRVALANTGKATVAAVNGLALGGGFELALACDFRIASQAASFAMPEITFGSIPAGGATQRIARLAGTSAALEIVLLGERIDAETAFRLNLVNRVVAPERTLDEARAWAAKLAARAPLAIKYGREAVLKGCELPMFEAIRLETYLGGLLRATEDRKEGRAAMAEKRPPAFKGR